MKIRKVTKAELEAIEFSSAEPCYHLCHVCHTIEKHQIPFGPMLEPICKAGIFITCLKCRVPPTKEEIESIADRDIRQSVINVEKRFATLRGKSK